MGKKNKRKGHPKPHYGGKPLWQLLENLPNHGVGRLIVRGSFRQDEEHPSYMRILTVDMTSKSIKHPDNPKNVNKIRIPVTVEKVWRGVISPKPCNIQSTSYLPDYILIPEAEEEKYVRNAKTASECNYVYWTAGQKKRIKESIEQGMSPEEAKQREKERIALQEAEAGGSTSSGSFNQNQSIFEDNFDDDIDEDDDHQNFPERQVQKNSASANKIGHGPSRGSKRSWPQKSNKVSAKLRKQ
ncbi:uncharacterized protein LOC105234009 [Bactrocera dorsalis]|uniref:Uncharacterized protein LOC105234009 n=1 Tax=Bactrocera dorsalis TaxID=27457 RepID=A0A034W837_BACDO|nr:uncharacterized protein LOC105234009 [Bactrocera dorsalis]